MTASLTPADYPAWLANLKTRIRETRLRAALAVNSELIGLYWRIGHDILERQAAQGWGSKIVERLAADLRAEFPDARGFSSANLRYMRSFAEAWPDPAILQRLVGKLPWGQNIELLAIKDPAARLWYAEAVLENGWSRPVLAAQIDTNAHARHGKALTNFSRTLPPETSDLAQQVLKDPYQFDFLTLRAAAHERDVERALVTRVKDLLLELGKGFSFIASQHHLEVGGQDFYVDLLFYHRRLRCLVAVDLKKGPFKPEHAGKMNFYLAALDDLEREPGDSPSIGLSFSAANITASSSSMLCGMWTRRSASPATSCCRPRPCRRLSPAPCPPRMSWSPACCRGAEPTMNKRRWRITLSSRLHHRRAWAKQAKVPAAASAAGTPAEGTGRSGHLRFLPAMLPAAGGR